MSSENDAAVAEIMGPLFREWREFYLKKNKDYQDHGSEYGVAGEIHNMGKKMLKLKRALWHGETLVGEQPREILLDMIGHCFQAIYLLCCEQSMNTPSSPESCWMPTPEERAEHPGQSLIGGKPTCAIHDDCNVWHDPTHGGIDRDIQEWVRLICPPEASIAMRTAMENTLQERRGYHKPYDPNWKNQMLERQAVDG